MTAIVLAAALGAGCGDDNPNNPSDTPPTFQFALTTAQEVPPVTNGEVGASGTVTIRLNLTRDAANTITAATTDFQVSLAGFPAGSTITAAHIHEAAVGQNGSFVVNLGLSSGQVALVNGAATFTRNAIATQPEVAQRILNDPSGFYFNVHSALNPNGVVRGQLVRTQ
jgi:hypothetical protein